jgi:hypothetical protein
MLPVMRIAWSMTIDPEGAMHDWVDLPAGWTITRIPTQEAVHAVGIRAYQEVLVDLAVRERPDVLVTHPPYDYLDEATAGRIRAAGTRLVGYAFDDEIFAGGYDEATWAAIHRMHDRYASTREVRWATAPFPAVPVLPAQHEVVLVGRAYARRRELVEALREADIAVTVRGAGWPEAFTSRADMLDLYARAAIVLTTGDWEGHPVDMVKHRLLDTAMAGVFQVAQDSPDLRGYFPADEVPGYRTAEELIATVRDYLGRPEERRRAAAAARARALAEHTWSVRIHELVGPPTASRPAEGRSALLDQLLVTLATRAEVTGRSAAALALFEELLGRVPDEPAALLGVGRLLRDRGELARAIPFLVRAAAVAPPVCSGAVRGEVPPAGIGTGMGRLGLYPPDAEAHILLVASLVEAERMDEALAILDGITRPSLGRALAQVLVADDDPANRTLSDRLRTLGNRGSRTA